MLIGKETGPQKGDLGFFSWVFSLIPGGRQLSG